MLSCHSPSIKLLLLLYSDIAFLMCLFRGHATGEQRLRSHHIHVVHHAFFVLHIQQPGDDQRASYPISQVCTAKNENRNKSAWNKTRKILMIGLALYSISLNVSKYPMQWRKQERILIDTFLLSCGWYVSSFHTSSSYLQILMISSCLGNLLIINAGT